MQKKQLIDPKDLSLDPLAELTMTYTCDGFEELKASIREQSQHLPITLRNGKVIDGRHRLKACEELGIKVWYEELGDVGDSAALDYVVSRSINKSIGSDASRVEAYLMCKAKGVKLKDMPSLFRRLNINYVRKLSFIEKEDPRYLTALLRQKQVRIFNKEKRADEDCGTIHGIWYLLKINKGIEDTVIEIDPDVEDTPDFEIDIDKEISNPEVRTQYWKTLEACGIKHPAAAPALEILRLVKIASYKTLDTTVQSGTLAPDSFPD